MGNPKPALPHGIPVNVLPWMHIHCVRSHCFRLIYRSHNVTCCRITVYLTQGLKQMPSFFNRRKKHSMLDTCSQHTTHMPEFGALPFLGKVITSEKYLHPSYKIEKYLSEAVVYKRRCSYISAVRGGRKILCSVLYSHTPCVKVKEQIMQWNCLKTAVSHETSQGWLISIFFSVKK